MLLSIPFSSSSILCISYLHTLATWIVTSAFVAKLLATSTTHMIATLLLIIYCILFHPKFAFWALLEFLALNKL
jgi:hypothetical protein